eukprot:PLAT11062.1.p1 GENE.PLAT11062.1~~PLAT11062.1.p1  ORF type:complete len:372 (-),score=114.64 PLAT11062.1:144-1208(-)
MASAGISRRFWAEEEAGDAMGEYEAEHRKPKPMPLSPLVPHARRGGDPERQRAEYERHRHMLTDTPTCVSPADDLLVLHRQDRKPLPGAYGDVTVHRAPLVRRERDADPVLDGAEEDARGLRVWPRSAYDPVLHSYDPTRELPVEDNDALAQLLAREKEDRMSEHHFGAVRKPPPADIAAVATHVPSLLSPSRAAAEASLDDSFLPSVRRIDIGIDNGMRQLLTGHGGGAAEGRHGKAMIAAPVEEGGGVRTALSSMAHGADGVEEEAYMPELGGGKRRIDSRAAVDSVGRLVTSDGAVDAAAAALPTPKKKMFGATAFGGGGVASLLSSPERSPHRSPLGSAAVGYLYSSRER